MQSQHRGCEDQQAAPQLAAFRHRESPARWTTPRRRPTEAVS
jgi:hypothetical protein